MALGSNLKKKQLIPDASEGDKPKKKVTKNVKKSTSKTSSKKPNAASKKAPIKSKSQKATPASKGKSLPAPETPQKQEVTPKEKQSETTKVIEEVPAADVLPTPVTPPSIENAQSGNDQIISAYSVYIAQQLHERKYALREKYYKEITELQGKPVQFILISIGSELYALDIDCVKEVVPLPAISRTPNTPNHVQGVVNVRGNTYVVFDLAAKFNVVAQEVPRYLLVLTNRDLKSSVPLSVLPETFKTNGDQISHSLQTIEDTLLDASYIKGIIHDEDKLIYYLDLVELLKNEKAIVMPDNLVEEK